MRVNTFSAGVVTASLLCALAANARVSARAPSAADQERVASWAWTKAATTQPIRTMDTLPGIRRDMAFSCEMSSTPENGGLGTTEYRSGRNIQRGHGNLEFDDRAHDLAKSAGYIGNDELEDSIKLCGFSE